MAAAAQLQSELDAPWTFVPKWKQAGKLGARWKKVAGEDHWAGLLDEELDADLKNELLRTGEFAQASYDAFDNEAESIYRGSSLHHPTKLLERTVAPNTGYTVTRFLWSLARLDVFKAFPQATSPPSIPGLWSGGSDDSNWAGFVAVATDPAEIARLGRRDVLVVWRGTLRALEWVQDVQDVQVSVHAGGQGNAFVKAMQGFWDLFTDKSATGPATSVASAQEQANAEVRRLVAKYKDEALSITVVGHSLGAALAQLCAYDLAASGANQISPGGAVKVLDEKVARDLEQGVVKDVVQSVTALVVNPFEIVKSTVTTVQSVVTGTAGHALPNGFVAGTVPITVHAFAGPRVGNDVFRDALHNLGVKVLRPTNSWDVVPRAPGIVTNEFLSNTLETTQVAGLIVDSLLWTYTHTGVELALNSFNSTFLKNTVDLVGFHNLATYLHLITAYESKSKPFNSKLAEERDLAPINDRTDYLKAEYLVPGKWWQTANKGLVRHPATGRWVVRPRVEEDKPSNFVGLFG